MLLSPLRGPGDVPVPYPLRRLFRIDSPPEAMQQPVRLPAEWHAGHLLVRALPGLAPWLIDTGAPRSATHRRGDGYLGKSLADIEKMVGCQLDRLIGLDVLAAQPVLLTCRFVEFGAARPPRGRRISCLERAPYLPVRLPDDSTRLCLFDTGAPVSYALPRLVQGRDEPGWYASDFFPSYGEWETALHSLPVQIAGKSLVLMPGVLPSRMAQLVSEHSPLVIGSELLEWVDVWMDLRNGEIAVGQFC